jgi:glyoxylase-like metal-dependent hydrolase (beta-lactamase superfamily II)
MAFRREQEKTMKLIAKAVGPWPMNTYLLVSEQTHMAAIVDPGADAEFILEMARGLRVDKILLTHGHRDHTGALAKVRKATGATVYIHPADGKIFRVKFDLPLADGQIIDIGSENIRTIHTPGHTPGETCFDLGDGHVLVGDALFVNGPGATQDPESFAETMRNMQAIFFAWPDKTVFYPGHGSSGKIGDERPAFEAFVRKGWPPNLHGDVAWRQP